jgi:hypothetical protein
MHDARQPLKQKAGYKANGTAHIFFPTGGFRVSRPLIQDPGCVFKNLSNQQVCSH